MADTTYQLTVMRGPRPGQTFTIEGDSVTIGRDPMSEIVINDPEISRQHARISQLPSGGYQVQDLGSTNGTFINGDRLGGDAVELQNGQLLAMGSNVALAYEILDPDFDPMATVVAPMEDGKIDLPEMPAVDQAEEIPASIDLDFESPATEPEMPAAAEPDPMTTIPPAADLPDFDPPIIEEPITTSEEAVDEPTSLPDFSEPDALPDFSASTELPDFSAPDPTPAYEPIESLASSEKPMVQQPMPGSPPPPISQTTTGAKSNRNRNIVLAIVAVLLLCCCCILISFYSQGDDFMIGFCQEFVSQGNPVPEFCEPYYP